MKTAILAFGAILAAMLTAAQPACADAMPAATVQNGVRIVVPARNIARGEIISDSDLAYDTVAANRAYGGVVTAIAPARRQAGAALPACGPTGAGRRCARADPGHQGLDRDHDLQRTGHLADGRRQGHERRRHGRNGDGPQSGLLPPDHGDGHRPGHRHCRRHLQHRSRPTRRPPRSRPFRTEREDTLHDRLQAIRKPRSPGAGAFRLQRRGPDREYRPAAGPVADRQSRGASRLSAGVAADEAGMVRRFIQLEEQG